MDKGLPQTWEGKSCRVNETSPQNRPVFVIACQVFKHWIENLLAALPGWDGNITFFDYALHSVPKNLHQAIQEAIDSIEKPSLVILGYGLCGGGLNDIHAGRHFLLIPRSDDCIAMILGSYEAYRREIKKEPGTYYLSKGWLEGGSNPLIESQDYTRKYGQRKSDWLMDYQYHNYKRLVMVARNPHELEIYREKALEVADYCTRWGMRYEELVGSDAYIQELVKIAANFDRLSEEFLLIPPGGILKTTQFIRGL